MPGFEFVTVTNPGEIKRHSTKIRRHVMKDIGKARRKPKPKDRRQTSWTVTDAPDAETSNRVAHLLASGNGEELSEALAQVLASPNPGADCRISSMVFPFEMDENRLSLARYMVEEARYVYRPFRFAWLSMGLADAASWNITLANAVLYRNQTLGAAKPEFFTNWDAMKYYTRSLESIKKRLEKNDEKVAEGLVVAVTGLACHDSAVGNFVRMEVHMNGLKRIVEKKGGLEELHSPFLRLMISWLDMARASFLDTTPYFPVPRGSITQIDTANDRKYLDEVLERWNAQCRVLGDIKRAIRATAAVSIYINRHSHDQNFWKDDIMVARLLGPALFEILTLEGHALPNDPLSPEYSAVATREAFRRAALVWVAAVKLHCKSGAWDLPKHLDAFRQISKLPLVDWMVVPELNLWAHVVAAMQEQTSERTWHVTTIVGIVETLGLTSGAAAIDTAKRIIWVDAIDGGKAGLLCQEIDGHLESNRLSRQFQFGDVSALINPQLQESSEFLT